MADVANKYAENVAGAFYVDEQCIDCDLCRETAPASFKRNDDGGHTYVYKQPETPEEEALCKEAMEGCPVEAIGNDGAIDPPFDVGADFTMDVPIGDGKETIFKDQSVLEMVAFKGFTNCGARCESGTGPLAEVRVQAGDGHG